MTEDEIRKINRINFSVMTGQLAHLEGYQLHSRKKGFELYKLDFDRMKHKVMLVEVVIGNDGKHRELDTRYRVVQVLGVSDTHLTVEVVGKEVSFTRGLALDNKPVVSPKRRARAA